MINNIKTIVYHGRYAPYLSPMFQFVFRDEKQKELTNLKHIKGVYIVSNHHLIHMGYKNNLHPNQHNHIVFL